jgi:heterodisulfide reductase subunit B
MRYLILLVFLSGCLSQNKLAKVCSERFPIKEEIKEVLVIDTILTPGDTIRINSFDSSLKVICPPNKTIIKNKEVKIVSENTAKIYSLEETYKKQINKLNDNCDQKLESLNKLLDHKNKEIDKLNKKLESVKKFKYRFYTLLSIIILYFVLKFGIKRLLSSF